jgi:hypothetical protein
VSTSALGIEQGKSFAQRKRGLLAAEASNISCFNQRGKK